MDESWVSAAQFSDSASAVDASDRLTAENIPNKVWRETFCVYHVRVPPESLDSARQTLEAAARMEEEGPTRSALEASPPDDYVPVPSTSPSVGNPQARHLAVLMPIGSAVLLVVFAANFAMGLKRFMEKGVVYPTFCTASGCRNSLAALVAAGLGTLVMLLYFLSWLGVGRRDK
jgi:hypothetical protein